MFMSKAPEINMCTLCDSYFSIQPLSNNARRTAGNPPPFIMKTFRSLIAVSAIFLSSFHLSLLTQLLYCLNCSIEDVVSAETRAKYVKGLHKTKVTNK